MVGAPIGNTNASGNKKSLDDLPESWQNTILEMMKEGDSKQQFKAALGISNRLHTRFMQDEPLYQETVKEGEKLCQAWWEGKAKDIAVGKIPSANATMMIFNLKNRFPNDWKDRIERHNTGTLEVIGYELSETERSQRITALLDTARERGTGSTDND